VPEIVRTAAAWWLPAATAGVASTTNALTMFYGTAWSDDCLLEKQRQSNLEAERRNPGRSACAVDTVAG
jgi:hypothetical protein